VKTLLIDGDNLFKIGFHGVREYFVDGNHIGGVFHFLNTVRKQLEEHNYDRVIVFWDGDGNSISRREIYPKYKLNRRQDMNEFKFESYQIQKSRVKEYLEECFVRQIRIDGNESDDLIAFYCQIAQDEDKVIFSSDKDLFQLIGPTTSLYSPIIKELFKMGDKVKFLGTEIIPENVMTIKVIMGDKSDNIDGIAQLGEKTFLRFFPEVVDTPQSVDDILSRTKTILKENGKNKALENLLLGKTKEGELGDSFFDVNKKIVDLSNPMITEDAKEIVELYYKESLDPEGRGSKNLIRMMTEDGFFKFLPKTDEAFLNFVRPFMKLTRKEKRKFKNQSNL
jgi:5'-3' exonuclease